MCGRSNAAVLEKMGIHTIGDLAKTDSSLVETWLKSHGRMLWEYSNGIDASTVETETSRAKGVGCSITLPEDVADAEEAHRVLTDLAESVSERLQHHQFLAGAVSVEIRYASFRSVSRQATLEKEISSAEDVCR